MLIHEQQETQTLVLFQRKITLVFLVIYKKLTRKYLSRYHLPIYLKKM